MQISLIFDLMQTQEHEESMGVTNEQAQTADSVAIEVAFREFCESVRDWTTDTEWAKTEDQRHDLVGAIVDRPLSTFAIFQAGFKMAARAASPQHPEQSK